MSRVRSLLVLVVGVATGAWGASSPEWAAALTDLHGEVALARRGETTFVPVRDTTLLRTGDRVRTGEEGRALLFFADGGRQALGATSGLTVTERPGRPAAWFRALRRQLESVLDERASPLDVRGYQLRGYQLRGSQAEPPLTALRPRACALLEARPTFQWRAAEGVGPLELTLYDADENVLWSTRVEGPTGAVSYPQDLPALPAGEYLWEVADRAELACARFTVLDAGRARAVRADLQAAQGLAEPDAPTLPLIAARLEHRLWPAAEAELEAALRRTPADRTLALLLARVYSETRRNVPEELVASLEGGER